MDSPVKFNSDGISLAGDFTRRDGETKKRLPGIVVAHGFAGARYPALAEHLASLGYGVLSFDFRGYGKSAGVRGTVLPHEQVSDIKNAVTWLSAQPEIDPNRIAVIGSSLGGSIAIMAAAEDKRINALVSGCPLGHGDSALRSQYDTQEKFEAFMKKVEDIKRRNGKLARFEIVFIPENLRRNLPPGTPMEFTADTVHGFLALNPLDVIASIAPRPLYIIHADDDHVVPVKDAYDLKARAGVGCDLEIVPKGDHFIFGLKPIIEKIGTWLKEKFPP
jgi:fermentation-respiration switch protein FrsA (DUF1100 family)